MAETAQATMRHLRAAQTVSIVIFAAALLWPLAVVVFRDHTLTGVYEEGLGYRYFYNLRQLYDPAEFLFLPQGQFTDLIQKGIHLLLTATGHPPDRLYPRIDRFAYLSVFVFQLMAVAAFAWLITALRSPAAILLQAVYWAVPAYFLFTGYLLLEPDYPAAELALAIFAAGYVARIDKPFDWSTGHAMTMGAFLGIAVATKVTLILFPAVVIGFALLSSRDVKKIYVSAATGALTAFSVWALIMAVAFVGRRSFMRLHFSQLAEFLRNPAGAEVTAAHQQWPLWTIERFLTESFPLAIVYLAPVIAIAGLIGATRKTIGLVVVLVIGATISNYILHKRDYVITQVEAGLFCALVIWCLGAKVWAPAIERFSDRRALPALSLAAFAALSLMLVSFSAYPRYILEVVELNSTHQRGFARVKSENPGKYLWLVPTNHIRPFSIDSAIMKGGGNHFGQWMVPESPLMRKMFPNLDFLFNAPPNEAKIAQADRVFFAFYANDQNEATQLKNAMRDMKVSDWSCAAVFTSPWQRIAMCKPPQQVRQ